MGDEFAVDDESMAAMLCMGEVEGSQQDYLSQEAVGMTDPAEETFVTPALKVRQAGNPGISPQLLNFGLDVSDASLCSTLEKKFGYSQFRGDQLEVIKAVLSGRDAAVFWCTGSGKSLCYQIPALHSNKVVVVVSPLISLMEVPTLESCLFCFVWRFNPPPLLSSPPIHFRTKSQN